MGVRVRIQGAGAARAPTALGSLRWLLSLSLWDLPLLHYSPASGRTTPHVPISLGRPLWALGFGVPTATYHWGPSGT